MTTSANEFTSVIYMQVNINYVYTYIYILYIFMARNRVSKSCLMAELCVNRFVHFDCVPIYIYIYIYILYILISVNQKLIKNFWMGIARNRCGQSGHRTLKVAVSQEWIDGVDWFFAWWCKFRKAKKYFSDFWVNLVMGVLV